MKSPEDPDQTVSIKVKDESVHSSVESRFANNTTRTCIMRKVTYQIYGQLDPLSCGRRESGLVGGNNYHYRVASGITLVDVALHQCEPILGNVIAPKTFQIFEDHDSITRESGVITRFEKLDSFKNVLNLADSRAGVMGSEGSRGPLPLMAPVFPGALGINMQIYRCRKTVRIKPSESDRRFYGDDRRR
ncbi:hypothetical protein J6590_034622 [Homalodisca vitripennis]|nr:hypothetical protein J6590_034622 [Homalodisca vitripennis]